jgi:hypothetical protein
MQHPSLVISQRTVPKQRFTWQQGMPLSVQQQEQSPSDDILQRFCSVAQATSSSQQQCSLNPPAHFSNRTSQRGTIRKELPVAVPIGAVPPGSPNCEVAIPAGVHRSINIAFDIASSPKPVTTRQSTTTFSIDCRTYPCLATGRLPPRRAVGTVNP